jgi:ABC-type antimicrobial peptide transport system permease subunit
LLASSLENVAPVGLFATAIAIAIIVLAGVAAAFLPALRIMRVQPAGVLRS